MYLLLFLLWLAFNGRIAWDVIVVGIIVCAALYFFCCKFMSYSVKKDLIVMKEIPLIIKYVINLVIEVIKSTIAASRYIFAKDQPHSAIIKFSSGLKTNTAKVLLANSITLTPGTITVELHEDVFVIHCLDKSMGEGIEECSFVKQLRKMEEVAGV